MNDLPVFTENIKINGTNDTKNFILLFHYEIITDYIEELLHVLSK